MPKPLYTTTRNLHLYAGLFLSRFVLLFAVSVFSLVHAPRTAAITLRHTGFADALVHLHKMPGPHNVSLRGNSLYMQLWRWLADATSYGVLFLSLSGVYLWATLRAERRLGLALLAAGALTFFGVLYALTA